ncbi:MAG: hypothetical protein WBN90_03950 [Gammaproteobacteria bacterium]
MTTRSGAVYAYSYANADPRPVPGDHVEQVFVDKELANEAITYILQSGKEGSIHIDQFLEYNEDPMYLAELLIYKLTVEAQIGLEGSELSMRQIAKRLKTSVPQLYRLLDTTNTRKSMSQLIALLHVLNCEVDLVVRKKAAA